MPRDERRMTFVVIPHGAFDDLSTRSYEVSYRRLRLFAGVGAALGVILFLMAASWLYLAAQAARVPSLQREISVLQADRQRMEQLARTVARMEARYRQMEVMLAGELPALDTAAAGDSAAARSSSPDSAAARDSTTAALPREWPLASRGFVTRGHLARVPGRHPGIDIAVEAGSSILASAPGTVLEAGEDPVYGRFVRIGHGGGYETVYAHASRLLVAARERVGAAQVIALSGSTGRSTAPHLHFEIRKDGRPVDPRGMVARPE